MFKVGDTGFDKEGNPYTVVSASFDGDYSGYPQPIQARVYVAGVPVVREFTAEGHYYSPEEPQDCDLNPPDGYEVPANEEKVLGLLVAAGLVTEEQIEAARLLAATTL